MPEEISCERKAYLYDFLVGVVIVLDDLFVGPAIIIFPIFVRRLITHQSSISKRRQRALRMSFFPSIPSKWRIEPNWCK